jgi:N-acetylglucosaminylphosphatidylinositol deacetylase
LSNGGAYGLGSVREKEMIEACKELKVPEDNVIIIDHPDLQDGMKTSWPEELVAQQVHIAVSKYKANQVVTFDAKGVSGHINHIGAHKGVQRYMTDRQYRSANGSLQCFELVSTGIFRKFSGLIDLPVSSLFLGSNCRLVVNPFPGVTNKAMSKHRSQRTWYRHLFMLLSRYTMMNTLRKMERSQHGVISS